MSSLKIIASGSGGPPVSELTMEDKLGSTIFVDLICSNSCCAEGFDFSGVDS